MSGTNVNGTASPAVSPVGGNRNVGVSPSSSYSVISNSNGSQLTNGSFGAVFPNINMLSLTDITLEQAMDKVQELAHENSSLRECLRENNENMKKQYHMLMQWKEKVKETNKINLKKFEDLHREISELKSENDKYRQYMSSPEKEGSVLESLQDHIRSLQSEKQSMQQEREELQRKIDDLKSQLGDKSPDDVVIVNTLADQNEIECYKKRCVELAAQVQNFHQQNEQLMLDLQQVTSLKQSIQAENTKLNNDNLELQKKLQSVLGDINKTRYSIGAVGQGEGSKPYSYETGSVEAKEKVSITAKQDIEILEMQTAALERVSGSNTQEAARTEELSSAELSHELKVQRQTSQQLEQTIGVKEDLITQLKSQLREKDQMISQYKQQLASQLETVTQQHQHKQQQLMKQLDDLTTQLQQTKKSDTGDVQSLKAQVLSLIKESQELSTRLENTTKMFEQKNARVFELERVAQQQAGQLEEIYRSKQEDATLIQNMKMQLSRCDEALSRERQEHANSKHQLTELRASFNRLVNDYKELLDTFDKFKAGNQNKQLMDEINRLTAQTIAAEEAITYRDDQIKQLKSENAKLKEEVDNTIPVLRAQADVWKQDFDAERCARERQVAEKEVLLQEMRNLQAKNQQLTDELESYSRKSLAEMQRRHAPSSYQNQMQSYLQGGSSGSPGYPQPQPMLYPASPPQSSPRGFHGRQGGYSPHLSAEEHSGGQPQGPPVAQQHIQQQPPSHSSSSSHADDGEYQMTCPKCGISCPDLDTLQIHVMDCIDS